MRWFRVESSFQTAKEERNPCREPSGPQNRISLSPLTPLTGVSLAWLFLHKRKRPGEQLAARILGFPEPPLWAFLSWPVYVGASSTPTFLEQEALNRQAAAEPTEFCFFPSTKLYPQDPHTEAKMMCCIWRDAWTRFGSFKRPQICSLSLLHSVGTQPPSMPGTVHVLGVHGEGILTGVGCLCQAGAGHQG